MRQHHTDPFVVPRQRTGRHHHLRPQEAPGGEQRGMVALEETHGLAYAEPRAGLSRLLQPAGIRHRGGAGAQPGEPREPKQQQRPKTGDAHDPDREHQSRGGRPAAVSCVRPSRGVAQGGVQAQRGLAALYQGVGGSCETDGRWHGHRPRLSHRNVPGGSQRAQDRHRERTPDRDRQHPVPRCGGPTPQAPDDRKREQHDERDLQGDLRQHTPERHLSSSLRACETRSAIRASSASDR